MLDLILSWTWNTEAWDAEACSAWVKYFPGMFEDDVAVEPSKQ